MAKPTAVGFRPNTARRIIKRLGGETARTIPEWSRTGGAGQSAKFFRLVGDAVGSTMLGHPCDHTGEFLNEDGPATALYYDRPSRPRGAMAGYYGIFLRNQGVWQFKQGPCPDLSCDLEDAFIDFDNPPEGYVNEAYSHFILWDDLEDPPILDGIPPGMTYNSATGELGGTPTTPDTYTLIATGISMPNGCPITRAVNLTINPCNFADAFIDPDDPPDAEVDEPYSHFLLFDQVELPMTATGLPPGMSLNGSTGEISGTTSTLGTWSVTVSSLTQPNGCPISVTFYLTVGTCDLAGSALFNPYGGDHLPAPQLVRIGDQWIGIPYSAQIGFIEVELPIELIDCGSGIPDWIEFDGNTGALTGVPDDCTPAQLCFRTTSLENDCPLNLTLWIVPDCPLDCPDPYSIPDTEAQITPPVSCPINLDFVPLPEYEFLFNNVAVSSVLGVPSGMTYTPGSGMGTISGLPSSPGSYLVTFVGEVISGPLAGCEFRFDCTLVKS